MLTPLTLGPTVLAMLAAVDLNLGWEFIDQKATKDPSMLTIADSAVPL